MKFPNSPWTDWFSIAFVRIAGFMNAIERMILKIISRRQLHAIGGCVLGLLVALAFHALMAINRTPTGWYGIRIGGALLVVVIVYFFDLHEKRRL